MGRNEEPDARFVGLTLPTVVDKHPHFVGIATPEGEVRYLNPAARDLLGWQDRDLRGTTVLEIHPEIDHARILEEVLPALRRDEVWQGELHLVDTGGSLLSVEVTAFGIRRPGADAPSFIAAAMQDITERQRERQAMARERARSEAAEKIAGLGYWEWEIGTETATWSQQMYRIFGRDPACGALDASEFLGAIHPADRDGVAEAIRVAIESGEPYEREYRFICEDGSTKVVRAQAVAERDDDGKPTRLIGVNFDVTEQAELQRQLRAADRLTAVGQLAGGIAHDFNNILTAITGHADLARADLDPGHPVLADLEQITEGCRRAGELTRQLLAFSGRQILTPSVVDLNEIIAHLREMLRRLIPENVIIRTRLAPDLPRVRADVTQLEQVILNLALNARDAMPEGGELAIVTSVASAPAGTDAKAGILLTICDDGLGMSAGVLRHVFEPFFTTKPVGQGGGMGLATVYGIIRQSGGDIDIDSTPGAGTTVRIRLAASDDESAAPVTDAPTAVVGGAERILVVEDDETVRRLARRGLEEAGYAVASAPDAESALRSLAARQAPAIELLITDVVLPGMTGHHLAERVRQHHPDLRVLYISGYSGSVIADHGVFDPESHVLAKPFAPDALLRKVRQVLEESVPAEERAGRGDGLAFA